MINRSSQTKSSSLFQAHHFLHYRLPIVPIVCCRVLFATHNNTLARIAQEWWNRWKIFCCCFSFRNLSALQLMMISRALKRDCDQKTLPMAQPAAFVASFCGQMSSRAQFKGWRNGRAIADALIWPGSSGQDTWASEWGQPEMSDI